MEKVENKKIWMNLAWLRIVKRKITTLLMTKQREKQITHNKTNNDYFISLIHKAKKDLEQSKNFFANVTDPDLVDYAAHRILANQSFYAYLLKKAKAENITFDI